LISILFPPLIFVKLKLIILVIYKAQVTSLGICFGGEPIRGCVTV